ncbi:ABC transporter permease [Andreprevotia chitinilytica]|uniref:ABC transporter permease n=1 Tax=Andreprevotia chitinilytica TaxID=396808 RepID=UPI000B203039|nr:iron ABC transporter permease [Andreprevotia chitinilytica]
MAMTQAVQPVIRPATQPTTPARHVTVRGRASFWLFGAAACVALLVLLPLAFTLRQALGFGAANAAELVFRPIVGELALNTLMIVAAATVTSAIVGAAAAWFVERTHLPGRKIWAVLAAAPLAVPPFITSYAWVSFSESLQDFNGALLVVTTAYYPLIYLPVAAALRGMDPALEETARSLGLGPWTRFFRVVLPQLKPALLGGMLLVALGTLSEFGAFALLRFRTFTTEIYAEYRLSFDGSGASMLASILMLLCLVCLALEFRVRGLSRYDRMDRGARRAPARYHLGWGKWPVLASFAGLTLVTLGMPLGMIVYWLLQHGDAAITPVEVSLPLVLDATLSSVGLGLAGAALTTVLALPLGLLLARHPGRIATLLERIVYLAQGLPGIVIALAIVSLAIQALRPLYQSAALLVVAYAILFLPLALVSVRAALLQVEPRLEDAARSLGLNRWQTLWRVVLPLAGPGLGCAAALVFISVMTELTATLLLAPIGTQTLAMQVWADTAALAFAAAAPYAAILVGFSLISTWLLMSLFGKTAVLGATS